PQMIGVNPPSVAAPALAPSIAAAPPLVVGDRPPIPLPRKAAPMRSPLRRPSSGGRHPRLRPRLRSRRAALSLGLALSVAGAASVVALAEIVPPANAGHLAAVGPVSASNGLPTWYKDDNNVRLEPCLDPRNSLCGALADETPDPDAP